MLHGPSGQKEPGGYHAIEFSATLGAAGIADMRDGTPPAPTTLLEAHT